MSSTNVIGSAFVTILPDTTKTTAQTVAGLTAAGNAGGKALATGVGAGATAGTAAAGAAFSKFGSSAATALGPAFAPIEELKGKFEGLAESIKKEGPLSAAGLAGMGTAALGAGVALQAMGSADASSLAQLKASITATGQSYDDYRGKIEEVVKSDEHLGITEAESNRALQTLTSATGDANRATQLMGLTADLAAAKHQSLSAAATSVGRAAEGNTRLFKLYGIQVQTNADGTKNIDGALDELSAKLKGQASASVDSFTGRLKVMGTEVEDSVAKFGQKWGPTIVAAGAGLELLGGLTHLAGKGIEAMRSSTEAATTATEADTTAAQQSALATQAEAAAAAKAQIADSGLAGAESRAAAGAGEQATAAEGATAANLEMAASSEAAAGGGLLKMAAGATVVTAAIIGVGLVVNHFMQESKKLAEENKKAFDDFWHSVSANRNQNSLEDLKAESADLTAQIKLQKDQLEATGIAHTSFGRSIEHQIDVTSPYAKQLAELNTQIQTQQKNVGDLSSEFHMNAAAVEDLAAKNNVDLGGAYDGIEKKFQDILGGTAAQITQMSALEGQYHLTGQAVTDFASTQKITLDGTAAGTTAFQAAVTAQQQVGSSAQILKEDYDKLASSTSSVTDKENAFKGILDEIIGSQLSAAQAADDFQQKINDMGTSLDKSTHSIEGSSDAAINNRKVIEDLAKAAITAAENTYKQTGSIDAANAAYDDYYAKASAAATANGITQTSLNDLLGSFNALPNQVAAGLGTMVDVGHQAGSNTIDGIAATLTDPGATKQLAAASTTLSGTIASQLVPFMSAAGNSAGEALTAGLAAGIANDVVFQHLADQVDATANRVVARYRQDLQTHSPSRVTYEIGRDVALGFGMGIADGVGGVADAVGVLTAATAPSAAGSLSALGTPSGGSAAAAATSTTPVSVHVVDGVLTVNDLQPILDLLSELSAKMDSEIGATNKVTNAVYQAAGAELAALEQEISASRSRK